MRNLVCKIFSIVFLCALSSPVFSQPRSLENIRSIALRHYQVTSTGEEKTRAAMDFELIPSSLLVSLDSDKESFYLCNASDKGFVLVSADASMPEILGYSDTTYNLESALPDGLIYVLKTYASLSDSISTCRTRAQEEVQPLLTMSWNQGDPYNQLCPLDGNAHSQTGCVATGAAQIMKYYEWPAKSGRGTIEYTTETKKLDVKIDLENTTFAWNMMKDSYVNDQYSQWEATAVARLMFAIGAACKMDYGREESATTLFNCARGLNRYFGYDEDMCMLLSNYVPAEIWQEMLIRELNESRPVLFSGNSAAKNTGHAFVLDGYQQKNGSIYFHANWGWSGSCNGYYLINNMKPTYDGKDAAMGAFNDMQMMLLNFQPDDGKENPTYSMVDNVEISRSNFSSGEPISFSLSYKNLACFLCRDFSGSLYLDLLDENGQLVKNLNQQKMEIPLGMFMEKGAIDVSNVSLKDGKYTLRLYLKEKDGRILATINHHSLPLLQVGGQDAIETVHEGQHPVVAYDLKGQKKQSANNCQLPAGFYVIDGKKVLICE